LPFARDVELLHLRNTPSGPVAAVPLSGLLRYGLMPPKSFRFNGSGLAWAPEVTGFQALGLLLRAAGWRRFVRALPSRNPLNEKTWS
jgi:hypothetical protein